MASQFGCRIAGSRARPNQYRGARGRRHDDPAGAAGAAAAAETVLPVGGRVPSECNRRQLSGDDITAHFPPPPPPPPPSLARPETLPVRRPFPSILLAYSVVYWPVVNFEKIIIIIINNNKKKHAPSLSILFSLGFILLMSDFIGKRRPLHFRIRQKKRATG